MSRSRRRHPSPCARRTRRVEVGMVLTVALVVGALGSGVSPAEADGNEAPGAPASYRSITAGAEHTCAILAGGSVKCWGSNLAGRLGLGDTANRGDAPGEMGDALPTVALGTGRTATALSAGSEHTCALLDNGNVKCWGSGGLGRMGLGDTQNRGDQPAEMGNALPPVPLGTGRTAVAVAAGRAHTCALLDNGTVKCWGHNGFGSGTLGLGDDENRGDEPGEMGDNLPAVDLGSGRTATALAAGSGHTCVILDTGAVKCWGDNLFGQLGIGSFGDVRGAAPGQMGDNLPTVALGTGRTATAISAGPQHTCALLDNAAVKCWGRNNVAQLGAGDDDDRGGTPAGMGDNLPVVALGTGRTATSVATSGSATCARLDDASVKCWGANDYGQLGLGDAARRGDIPGHMGDGLPAVQLGTGRTVVSVTTGTYHGCAVLDDGAMKCWGRNTSGQLGWELGPSGTAAGDDPGEMGDALPPALLVDPPAPPAVQLDAELRRSTSATYLGDGVYNATGAGQTVATSIRRTQTVTFVVRVRNEATSTDTISVSGPGSTPGFTVRYLVGTTNVTTDVVSGSFEFLDVAPAATRMLKVKVTVAANATVGAVKKVKVTATSSDRPLERDAVRAKVTALV